MVSTTDCKWDTTIDLELLWKQYKRIIKDYCVIVLFGSQPFTTTLINSNINWFKYEWIWQKSTSAGFIHAKNMPLKRHENIIVFSNGAIAHKTLSKKRMVYNPQGLIKADKIHKRPKTFASSKKTVLGHRPSHTKEHKIEYENYPHSILIFPEGNNNHIHPTQKPVSLCEYLIKTYTNENNLILDNCMGAGTTGIACINTNRNYVGFELDEEYYNKSIQRINEHMKEKNKVDSLLNYI